ncbi:MAG TPA: PspA/IM30 family protein [Polyangiales bacterium]|nr:PspA/IM30 family protein [Polyangiales bacterium]
MANIQFFARLGNLWSGFISLWLEDIERKQPEIAYENAVQSMTEKYVKLRRATAAIIRRREELEARNGAEQKELAQVSADLNAAIDTNQDDLAVLLIQKKNAITASIAELSENLAQAKADADDAKSSLLSVKAEIDKLKAEKDRMLAKMESAQARLKIQEQIEGLSVDADVKALDTVRTHIKNVVSEAKLGKELADSDLDTKLKALRQHSGTSTARSELDALKAARAQQAAGQVKKSM